MDLAVFAIEQAYQIEAMSVPDFVAGFVYGMTGDNHLTELEACYTGGTDVVHDVQTAVTKIESGSYIVGFAEIGKIINEFPAALTTCQNMDEDIAAIEEWATIFTEPETLAKTLSKNWLLHRSTIKKDLANEQSDWAAGNFFQAGVDTALALTEAVGPIETTNELSVDLMKIPDFVAGFVYGVTGDLELQEFETCMQSTGQLEQYITGFVSELKQVHLFKAFMDLQKFIFHLQADLEPCKGMSQDVQILESWASIFEHPEELGETLTFNFLENRQTIKDDIAKEQADWSSAQYFNAGQDVAEIAVTLIGPAPTEIVPEANYGLAVDVHEINHILAGFIYGMTTQNHLTEIEGCYSGASEMDQELHKAVHDFKAGGWDNITQGVLEVLLIGFQMPQELKTCENMTTDLAAIEAWAEVFTNKTELISTVTKHYLLHKKAVTADIATLKTDYSSEAYFQVGEDVATIATVLLGPIE